LLALIEKLAPGYNTATLVIDSSLNNTANPVLSSSLNNSKAPKAIFEDLKASSSEQS